MSELESALYFSPTGNALPEPLLLSKGLGCFFIAGRLYTRIYFAVSASIMKRAPSLSPHASRFGNDAITDRPHLLNQVRESPQHKQMPVSP